MIVGNQERGWAGKGNSRDGFNGLEAWLQKTREVWSRRLDILEKELRAEDEANERKAKKKAL